MKRKILSGFLSVCMVMNIASLATSPVLATSLDSNLEGIELVIDNEDANSRFAVNLVTASASNNVSTSIIEGLKNRIGANHYYTNGLGNYTTWTPKAGELSPGYYKVYFNKLIHKDADPNMQVAIKHNKILEPGISINLRKGDYPESGPNYILLGTYYFSGDGDEYVCATNGTQGSNIRCDAVKFVPINFNPNITASLTDTNDVCIQWDIQSWTEGYKLYRGTLSDATDRELITTITNGKISEYIDADTLPQNTYYYWIEGYDQTTTTECVGPSVGVTIPLIKDKEGLEFLIQKAKELVEIDYQEGWQIFISALTEAISIKEDSTTGENEVEAAYDALENAMQLLVVKEFDQVNRTSLKEALKAYEALDLKLYEYANGYEAVNKLYNDAIVIENDYTYMQSQVNKVAEELVKGINNLKVTYFVDDSNLASYIESSDRFSSSSTGNQSFNSAHRYVQYVGDYGQWNIYSPQVGVYDIYYYLPLQHANNEKNLKFEISSFVGTEEKMIDISTYGTGDWIYIGAYPFVTNQTPYVRLINTNGTEIGTTRYDAIKCIKVDEYPVAPSIENLEISGSLVAGGTLKATYEYKDFNGDVETGSTYRWLRGDADDTNTWNLIREGTIEEKSQVSYEMTIEDINKYIRLEIIPKTITEPNSGEMVFEIVGPVADQVYAPEAVNLTLQGKPWTFYELIGNYDYIDKNGDEEEGSEYTWYVSEDKENWESIQSGSCKSDQVVTLIPDTSYIDKYVRFSITPNSTIENDRGEEIFSNSIGPIIEKDVAPIIKDVKLEGQIVLAEGIEGAAVDGIIDATYVYTNELVIPENIQNVQYKWYVSSTENGEYTEIEDAVEGSFAVLENYAHQFIKVGVKTQSQTGIYSEEAFSKPYQVKWRLSFVDEFDYTAVDGTDQNFTKKWISDSGPRELNGIKSARIPENVEVKDGYFYIHNRKETNPKYSFEHNWTTGNVMTANDDFKYGYYECSYQFAPATGLNQSFWTMTDGVMNNDKFIEIDFTEGHYPYEMATNLHYKEGTTRKANSIKYYPLGKGEQTFATEFNKVSGQLKPNNDAFAWDAPENSDTYTVYYNDQLQRSTKSLPYEPNGARIYLSVAIFPGFAGPLVDSEADGTSMVVDYVRYYTPLESIEVEGVTLNVEELVLTEGEAYQLVANVLPENATNKGVMWKSSNPQIVTVDEKGLVSGVAEGEAEILVTTQVNNYTTSCAIKVVLDTKEEQKLDVKASESALQGEVVDFTIGVKNIDQKVYAQDFVIEYDQNVFEWMTVKGKDAKTNLYNQEIEGGRRIVAAIEDGLSNNEDNIIVSLKVKDTAQVGQIQQAIVIRNISLGIIEEDGRAVLIVSDPVSKGIVIKLKDEEVIDKTVLEAVIKQAKELVDQADIGEGDNQYPQVAVDALNKAIVEGESVLENSIDQSQINEAINILNKAIGVFEASQIRFKDIDVNGDEKIDVADLALIAYHYRKTPEDIDWDEAQKADINSNKVVDLVDLVLVANKILMNR